MAISLVSLLLVLSSFEPVFSAPSPSLPKVDLGYTIHQASTYNATGDYYTFSDVAYARPPLGSLRFSAPQPPLFNRSVQVGGPNRKACPQAVPTWLPPSASGDPNQVQTEDCLVLDIHAPPKTLQKAHRYGAKAPVLVWIHGGGFTLGSKTISGGPAGLLAQQKAKEAGMIFVALNYRLGAFGFLNGPEFRKQSGIANVGLLDQRAALDWIQNHIEQFGGDKNRITLMGESGGAAALVMQQGADQQKFGRLTARQAIYQSTANTGTISDQDQDKIFADWLHRLNATNLGQVRSLDTALLQKANRDIVAVSPVGSFTYSVAIEDKNGFLTKSVPQIIRETELIRQTKGITASNVREGLIFTSPANVTFSDQLSGLLPDASKSELTFIENTLYPPHSASTPYIDDQGRKELLAAELLFGAQQYGIQKVRGNTDFAYQFSVFPGVHTQDLRYTFYNGNSGVNGTIANTMQAYFANFAVTGEPNAGSLPTIPQYGTAGNTLNLTEAGFKTIKDPFNNKRCEYWAQR